MIGIFTKGKKKRFETQRHGKDAHVKTGQSLEFYATIAKDGQQPSEARICKE